MEVLDQRPRLREVEALLAEVPMEAFGKPVLPRASQLTSQLNQRRTYTVEIVETGIN